MFNSNFKDPLKSYLFMFNDETLTTYIRKIEFKNEKTVQLTYMEDSEANVTRFLKERNKPFSLSLISREGKEVYTILFNIVKMSTPYPLLLGHDIIGVVEMTTTFEIEIIKYELN